MTKSHFKATSFEDESDNRFPRARVLVIGEDTSLAAAALKVNASGGQQRIMLPSSVGLADDREIFEAVRMRRLILSLTVWSNQVSIVQKPIR